VRTPLESALQSMQPLSRQEADDLHALQRVAAGPAPWDRSTPLHLTASALVVHPPTKRVLPRWHERQQAWLQVGGHADPGEADPLQIAIREGTEETGLDDLRPWPSDDAPALVHAVIVDVPANTKEPAHRHGDVRYVLATQHPERAVPESDGADLRWLTLADAMQLATTPNVQELLRRVGDLFRDHH
jgi:8-oxo-dGTP pyrophosphatase MutT (NUDIX family)